jgi:hypothetical protein
LCVEVVVPSIFGAVSFSCGPAFIVPPANRVRTHTLIHVQNLLPTIFILLPDVMCKCAAAVIEPASSARSFL